MGLEMKRQTTVFVDFDGTITSGDVGYEMFKKFTEGRTEPTVERYRRGEINSYQCLSAECEIWNSNPPDPKEVLEYLDSRKIERGFLDFLQFLEDEKIEITILSEGFDFYIDRILNSHRLGHLNRITNRAEYSGGLIHPEFPYFESGCGQCSSCKGYHISQRRSAGGTSIFIGDGHSDIHAADAADVVFAKSFLEEHLVAGGRSYYAYRDFLDIIEVLRSNVLGEPE
jgi:2-hydroxy-3-keto-5-methylthiopentenyl-1-phosphate phosphatase